MYLKFCDECTSPFLLTNNMYKTVFHGGPPEEDPVSEERSDLYNEEKAKCKFVLFIQNY